MAADNSDEGGDSEETVRDPDHGPAAKEKPGGEKSPATDAAESGAGEAPVVVRAVDYRSADDYTRITVDLEQDVQFKSQRIAHPERIFFDLKNARLARELTGTTVDVNDGRVRKIRVAQYKPGLARIVIETDGRTGYNASLALNPPRLVIDVHGDGVREESKCTDDDDCAADDTRPQAVSVSEKAAKPSLTPGLKKVIVEADPDDPPSDDSQDTPTAKPSAKSRNLKSAARSKTQEVRAVPLREAQPASDGGRSLTRTLGLKIGKIVIDPGHGGHDAGTVGPNGLLEKDLVLDVSKRLAKLLSTRMGVEVVLTRRDDTFIPLETRTAIANQEQADLFVSVHANSSQDPDASGVETYYLNFTSSPEALEVAARENAASDTSIHELQDLVKKIALKDKIEESREFAADVQQSLYSGLARKDPDERDRGVKKAPFVVLIGANMPSILAEISFLSNPGEERRLRTPEYRQRIAQSLFRGIERYVNGLGGLKFASRMEKAPAE
jgi:N-acetylmuramoyl-L-alanine amidase